MKEIPNKAITEKKENGDIFTETSRMPFLMLGLDLPPPPLFKDVMEKNIIPQVFMHYVLARLKILLIWIYICCLVPKGSLSELDGIILHYCLCYRDPRYMHQIMINSHSK